MKNLLDPKQKKGAIGSNQYKTRRKGLVDSVKNLQASGIYGGLKKRTWISIILILIILAIFSYFGWQDRQHQQGVYISPLPKGAGAYTWDTRPVSVNLPELAPMSERNTNIEIIKRIWGKDAGIGIAIARAESGYRTNAMNVNTNGTVDQGVFQVNSIHKIPEMFDATANIAYAYSLYLQQGTTPWNSSKRNWKGAL